MCSNVNSHQNKFLLTKLSLPNSLADFAHDHHREEIKETDHATGLHLQDRGRLPAQQGAARMRAAKMATQAVRMIERHTAVGQTALKGSPRVGLRFGSRLLDVAVGTGSRTAVVAVVL